MLVETRLGRLFVEVRGEGPPLMLWHSLLCDGGMWRYQVPALEERYRVVNVDGPGHGRSAAVERGFTLEECVEVALEIMDRLELGPVHWAGLSWGGMIGMRLALYHPDRVRSLALFDTSARAESRRKLPSYHAMAFVARRLGSIPILLDRIEPIFFAAETRRRRREVVEAFRDHLARMDPPSVGHAVDAVIFGRDDIREILRGLDLPTLVAVGTEDVATPPARSREIAAAIRGARYVEIERAGHLSALDRPERVTELMLEHLGPLDA